MTTWRTGPDGRRRWYVPAQRAWAAATVEHDDLASEQSERLAAGLRKIDARKAAGIDEAVHYAPGDSPLCGEDAVGALCTHEPVAVAGCADCLELVVEDLKDRDFHQGTCLHCRKKISAKGGVEWRRVARRPCPHCGRPGW